MSASRDLQINVEADCGNAPRKAQVRDWLIAEHVDQLTIRHLLSHGKHVAAEGATPSSRFTHVITYTGHGKTAKVAEIISYMASVSG